MQYFTLPHINPAIFQIDPFTIGSFVIGPLAIRWYALSYIVGLLGGWWYARRLVGNPGLWTVTPGTKLQIDDLLIWATFGVIIGGRLGMFLYSPDEYLNDPLEILKVWHGGMAFHGGLVGAAVAVMLFAWLNKIPVLSYLDVVSAVAPIGLFFGRIANLINDELWGRPAWDSAWGVISPTSPFSVFPQGPTPRYPSQLFEAALEGLALFIILFIMTRMGGLKRPGLVAGTFGLGYAAARSFCELYREPDGWAIDGVLTIGQAYSLPMAVIGLGLIIHALLRKPQPA